MTTIFAPRRILPLLLLLGLNCPSSWSADAPISIRLPSKTDLAQLSDLVANATNVSLKYDPNKLRGNVRLNIQNELSAQALWDVYNQVLIGQQYATVVTGNPAVYHVVPFNEAAMLSAMITKKDIDALAYKPSYLVIVHELKHLAPDQAVKAMTSFFFGNQVAQIRTLGQDDSRIVIAGVTAMVEHSISLLASIDLENISPVVKAYEPTYATAQGLQSSATAAWAALERMAPGKYTGEIQLTPDQTRLLLIASQKQIDGLEKLVTDLDIAEPRQNKSYTPRFFTIDDVADLVEQIFQQEQSERQPSIIRDNLTNALIISATDGQHQRIAALMDRLDNVPPEGQKSMKRFVIKNRSAADLVAILSHLLQREQQEQKTEPTAHAAANATETAEATEPEAVAGQTVANTTSTTPNTTQTHIDVDKGPDVRLTTDEHTNSIIAISTPQQLAHVEALINDLDQRQPQVELEVIMVNLSDGQTHELGVELSRAFTSGGSSHNLSSLFNLSEDIDPTGTGVVTLPDSFAGFGGTVLNPGDFAGVIRALETVTDGKNIIRSTTVVGNNAESAINSVREEPITNFNAGDKFSTTTFSGTLDAGTEITITPQISAADYVTLDYKISQSAFLGETTITADGGTVPPPKRKDALNSIAMIPDGFVIALGGLSDESENESISKVPILGSIPLLGALFRSKSKSINRSTFHIFIRASILRNENFETLKHRTKQHSDKLEVEQEWPSLKARVIR